MQSSVTYISIVIYLGPDFNHDFIIPNLWQIIPIFHLNYRIPAGIVVVPTNGVVTEKRWSHPRLNKLFNKCPTLKSTHKPSIFFIPERRDNSRILTHPFSPIIAVLRGFISIMTWLLNPRTNNAQGIVSRAWNKEKRYAPRGIVIFRFIMVIHVTNAIELPSGCFTIRNSAEEESSLIISGVPPLKNWFLFV